jgi:TP901 family phage tail tape measure protein
MAAARGTLQLAAAAQTDVGTAADTTARALTAFGLSGDNAGSIADALANAAQSATGDIGDFALGLSQSATSAHQFGLTAQDTVTALTELAKAGIVGSDAGTSLRVMLTRLLPTSKAAKRELAALGVTVQDSKGDFLPFRDIIQQYSKSLARLTPVQRQHALQVIFGTDAQRAANIILTQSVGKYDKLNAVVSRQGGAARAAAAQQKGFKGAVDGFNSALQTTEVTIGTALLPVLTKYLRELAKWLGTSEHQEKLQKQVATAVHDTTTVLKDSVSVVKDVTGALGGLKSTLELLLALKIAGSIGRTASSLGGLTTKISTTRGAAMGLSGSLGNAGLAAQAGVAAFALTTLGLKATGADSALRKAGQSAQSFFTHIPGFNKAARSVGLGDSTFTSSATAGDRPGQVGGVNVQNVRRAAMEMLAAGKTADQTLRALEKRFVSLSQDDLRVLLRIAQQTQDAFRAAGGAASEAGAKAAHGLGLAAAAAQIPSGGGGAAGSAGAAPVKPPKGLTPAQRNTFFDNEVARILQRGGLGTLKQQSAALAEAAALITQRIAITKDITRKLSLEDQLLSIASQQKALRQQAGQAFLDSLQFGVDKSAVTAKLTDDLAALNALRAGIEQQIKVQGQTLELRRQLFDVNQKIADTRQTQRDRAQFFQLGLSPTGGERVPLATTLKRQAAQVSSEIAGTLVDSKKNESLLSTIKKLLNLKGLSAEVRTAIKGILDGIDQQLKDHANSPHTKFRPLSSIAFVESLGLNLTPEQKRRIETAFSTVGVHGTVPGGKSIAFTGAVTVNTDVNLDGQTVARNTTKHQRASSQNRSGSRRGPYAGRH